MQLREIRKCQLVDQKTGERLKVTDAPKVKENVGGEDVVGGTGAVSEDTETGARQQPVVESICWWMWSMCER